MCFIGRVINQWDGVIQEFINSMNVSSSSSSNSNNTTSSSSSSLNIVNREGRYDMRIPKFVIEKLDLTSYLEPIHKRLKQIMKFPKKCSIKTCNIGFFIFISFSI